MKRIISFIMSIVMIFSMLPMEALAAAVDGDAVYQLGDALWVKENETPTEPLEEGLTWLATEQTELRSELTCQLNPHVHEDNCPVDEAGNYTCGGHIHTEDCMGKVYACVEHTHDDSCKNSGYICGAEAHVHDADCEACTLEEHSHSADCLSCGLEEHAHSAECETTTYGCGLEGSEEHTHSEECAPSVSYTCGLEAHAHDDGCNGCGLTEHVHTADCEACTLEEHEHTEACVDDSYICGKEEHTHTEDCAYTEEAVCGEEEHIHTTDGCGVAGNYTCGLEAHTHDDSCYTSVTYVKWTVAEIPEQEAKEGAKAGNVLTETISWEILDGVLTITGEGSVPSMGDAENGDYTGNPWESQAATITEVLVGEGITGLGDYALYGLDQVTTVTLPSTLTSVGWYCFTGMESLERFLLAENEKLTAYNEGSLLLLRADEENESGMQLVGAAANSAPNSTLAIPEGVEYIIAGSLANNKAKRIVLPEGLLLIQFRAFENCENITEITIPAGLMAINDNAFDGCTSLETIRFMGGKPAGNMSATAFAGLDGITVVYPGDNTTWTDETKLAYGGSNITWVADSDAKCGDNATWTLENGVLTISGTGAVYGYSLGVAPFAPWYRLRESITSVVIGEGITELGLTCLGGLPNLTSIQLPTTMQVIGNGLQANNNNLASITMAGGGNDYFIVNGQVIVNKSTGALAVCAPAVTGTVTIPDGTKSIPMMAMSAIGGITVEIPDGLDEIQSCAFCDANGFTVKFLGAPPASMTGMFDVAQNVTVQYPNTNAWTEDLLQDYGGTNVTWSSYEMSVSNTCGENATWAIADGVLTISGTGAVEGYNPFDEDTANDAPWASQADSITKVVVEEGITKMGNHALTYLSSAESYELPSTLTDLDFGNFTGTSSLTVVTIPDSNPAYKAVNNLVIERESETLIAVPAGLTGSIVVPDGVTAIRSDAFALCHDQAVHLPNSLNEIQDGAFVQAKNMSLYFYVAPPETLGEEMFMMADGITVRYPYIEPWYQNAETLMVNYGGTNITWESATSGATGENVFWEIKDGVLTFSVQDTAQSGIIGGYMAGEGHYSPWYVHRDSITAIEIGEGITEIGFFAFDGLEKVKTVSFPASFTAPQNLGYGCFAGLTGLERFTVAEGNTAFSAMNGALVLTVTGEGGTEKVMFRAPTTDDFVIPEGLNVITQFSMAGSKLTSLQIPDSVYLIEPNAFVGAESLTSVTIAGEPNILDDAFADCDSLDTITFTGAAPSLSAPRTEGENTYSGSFHGLNGVTVYYPGTDNGWKNIINKPYGGSSIVWRKPAGCGDNATWAIEDGVLTISGTGAVEGYNPFDEDTANDAPWASQAASITRVVVEEGITKLGNHALANLPNVTRYELPSTLTDLDYGNFSLNPSLTTVTIPESNPAYMAVNNMVIEKESGMLIAVPAGITGSIVVPGNVTGVRSDAFVRCHDLEVHFQNGVKEVQSGAFVEAKNLVLNFLGLPPETLGEEMFMMADGITVRYPYFINWYGSADTLFKDYGGTNITWKSLDHGGCGENARFEIKDGVLTITGTGIMGGYMPNEGYYAPWKEYADTITAISVGEGITQIYQFTFTDLPNVKTISLPSTLTSVGYQCFSNLPELEHFNVAEGNEIFFVENSALLQHYVHKDTGEPGIILVRGPSITSGDTYYIPGVTVVGYGSLSGSAHQHIKVPATAWLVEPEAFGNCPDLVSVTFDYGMESILDAAFVDSTVETIRFLGNAPSLSSNTGGGSFYGIGGVNIIYPGTDTTWKNVINKSYGGKNVTWVASYEGFCGNKAEWMLNDGVLTIRGTDDMKDYTQGETPWYEVREQITAIVVENGITAIGDYAFYGCENVTTVSLPNSLTAIGTWAFGNCYGDQGNGNVYSINIPANVSTIEPYAFAGCVMLAQIKVDTANDYFQSLDSAFGTDEILASKDGSILYAYPASLMGSSFTAPEGVKEIADGAFYGCSSLYMLNLPESLKRIGENAFYGSTSLMQVTIADCNAFIDENAFAGCSQLSKLTIGTYGTISTKAFSGCSALKEIKFTAEAPVISTDAFQGVTAKAYYPEGSLTWTAAKRANYGGKLTWESYVKPLSWEISNGKLIISGIGAMDDYQMNGAPWASRRDEITAIEIETGVTAISRYAFSNLSNVTSVSLGKTLNEIGYSAFLGCSSLETITIPETVTFIDQEAFSSTGLTEILVDVNNESYTSVDGVLFTADRKMLHSYPTLRDGSSYTIPAGVEEIENCAFIFAENLQTITLPDTVKKLGTYAFAFGSLNLYFQGDAPEFFAEPFNSAILTVYYSTLTDGWDAVTGNKYGADAVTWIGTCEGRCGENVEWWIEDGVLYLEGSGTTDNYLDTTVPWYKVRSSITSVFVEEGITELGAGLLADLPNVTYIGLPSTLTSVGHQCFRNLPSLEGFGMSGNDVYHVENGALLQNYTNKNNGNPETALIQAPAAVTGEYSIPEGVTVIGFGAMAGSKASFVTMPDSVWIIEAEAFSGMQNTHIVLPVGLKNIQPTAFKNLKNSVIDFIVQPPEFMATDMLSGANTVTLRYPYIEPWYADAKDVIGGSFGGKYIKWEALNHGGTGENARWELNNGVLTFSAVDYNVEGPFGIIGGYMASEGHYAPWYPYRDSITSIVVEEGISHIGFFAFDGLSKVKTVSLPASFNETDSVGYGAFTGLTGLESFTVAEDNSLYSAMDGALVMTVTGEGGTETVMFRAPTTTGFAIPEGVNVIAQFSMAGSKRTQITIPDSVYMVEPNAFANCKSLTGVTIGEGMAMIHDAAFIGCSKLTSLTFEGGTAPTLSAPRTEDGMEHTGSFDGLGSITINYPATKSWADLQKQSYGATKATWKTVNSGNCGEYRNGIWSYASGVLTISGTGVISNPGEMVSGEMVYEGTTPWFGLKNSITSVVVKEGVTGLGHYLLAGLDKVTTITLPKSMTEYHTNTYANMPSLKTFKVTSGNPKYKVSGGALLYVDDYEFYVDTTLVRAPVNVTGIYSIPKGVTKIGFGALDGCKASQIVIPDSAGEIDSYVFTNCVNLKELTIPASVGYIADFAFYGSNLKAIYFQGGPLSYWGEQFAGLNGLNVHYTMDPAWDAAPKDSHGGINVTWYRDANPESSVHWRIEGDTLRFFGHGPIYGFMPSDEIYSPWSARADEIKHIVVEEGITEIGFNAFHDLVRASSVSLPQSLTNIGFQALADCVNVSEYTFPNGSVVYRSENNAIIQNQDNVLVRGPSGFSGGTYWVPYGVNVIGYGAFLGAQASGLLLPDTVTLIEPQAFKGMANLTEITIPASVETILDEAFFNTGIQSIYFQGESVNLSERPEDHEGGSFRAFEGTNLYHPDTESWTEIAKKDYGEVDVNWIIGSAQGNINWNVGDGKLTISGTGEIPGYGLRETPWFSQRDNITSIVVGEGVTSLGSMAFSELSEVKTISLPASLTDLGEGNFSGLYALEEVTIAAGNESFTFANGMLTGAGTLYLIPAASTGEFTIPAGIQTIHLGALEGCKEITVNVPADVKYIMAGAFADTEKITLVFQGEAPQIHEMAFNGATGASIGYPHAVTSWNDLKGQTFGGSKIRWFYSDVDEKNLCGDNAMWFLEDGVLTIQGSGAVTGWNWQDQWEFITKIVVEEGITSIGPSVFHGLSNVTEIQLPYSLTKLDPRNFEDSCNTGAQILFPNGSKVYDSPNGHDLVYLPTRTLVKVLTNSEVTHYDVPGNVLNIGGYAFMGYAGLKTVYVPGNVKSLERYAFALGGSLMAVNLGDSAVTDISDFCFAWNENLKVVGFGDHIYRIGNSAFSGCSSLSEIGMELNDMPYEASMLVTVESIGDNAFEGCTSLSTLLLADGMSYLGDSFIKNSGVSKLIFAGERPTEMGDYAFAYAPNLSVYTDPWVEGWSDEYKLPYRDEGEIKTTTYYNGFSLADDDIHWILKDGVLTITGTGALTTLDLLGIHDQITEIVVAEGITSVANLLVGDLADLDVTLPNLTKITLADSVESFDLGNLKGLVNLESIDLGGVTDLSVQGELILQNGKLVGTLKPDDGLLTIPATVTEIPAGALSNRKDIAEILIHTTSDMVIGEAAFAGLWSLEDIIFTGNAPQFHENAFQECWTTLLYPYGDTSWDTVIAANSDRNWLMSGYRDDSFIWFYIPWGDDSGELRLMGEGKMSDFSLDENGKSTAPWSDLPYTFVTIDERQTHIGSYAFYGSAIENLLIPDGVTSIGDYALANTDIPYLPLPSGLKTIGEGAFSGCGLFSLAIGDQVESIGEEAFKNNSDLTYLSIPATASVGKNAFQGCNGLWDITVTPGTDGIMLDHTADYQELPWNEVNWNNNVIGTVTMAPGVKTIGNYAFAQTDYFYIKLGNVEHIGDYAFYQSVYSDLLLPDTLKTIGAYAFDGSPLRYTLKVPANVTEIGEFAFANTGVCAIELPEGMETIPTGLLSNCEILESVKLPSTVTTIGEGAFANTEALSGVTFPNGLEVIDQYAFNNSAIKNLSLPNTLKTIGSNAFAACKNLTVVIIPESVTTIGIGAFQSVNPTDDGIHMLVIKSHDLTIGASAFSGNVLDEDVHFYGSEEEWATGVSLEGDTGIKPENVICSSDVVPVEQIHILDTNGKFGTKGAALDGQVIEVNLNKMTSVTLSAQVLPADADYNRIEWSHGDVLNYSKPDSTSRIGTWKVSGKNLTLSNLTPGEMTVQIQNRPKTEDDPNSAKYTWATTNVRLKFIRPVTKIAISGDYSGYLMANADHQMKAAITPSNATAKYVSWTVENVTGEAKIGDDGWLITYKPGKVIVRATAQDGSGVVAEKELEIVDYKLKITSADTLASGKSMTLKASFEPANLTKTSVIWELWPASGEDALDWVTLKGSTLTAKSGLTEPVSVGVAAMSKDNWANYAEQIITIYPVTTKVEIFSGNTDMNGKERSTINLDVNSPYVTEFTAYASTLPEWANSAVKWTTSDTKNAYAEYEQTDNQFTLKNFTGKTGKVTLTATAADGSGKKATLTVNFVKYPTGIQIMRSGASEPVGDEETVELSNGNTLTLTTDLAKDKTLTHKTVIWEVDEESAAYVTITSAGKLTVRNVGSVIENVIVRAKVNTMPYSDLPAEYITDEIQLKLYPAAQQVNIVHDGEALADKAKITAGLFDGDIDFDVTTQPGEVRNVGTWTSSNKKVATINAEGVLTPLTNGTVTVKYTADDGSKKSTQISLTIQKLADTVTISGKKADAFEDVVNNGLRGGKYVDLTAAVLAQDGTKPANTGVTWTVSDQNAASVSTSGRVTAKTVDRNTWVTVTATAKDGSGVSDSVSILIRPKTAETVTMNYDGANVTNKTITVDLNQVQSITPSVMAYISDVNHAQDGQLVFVNSDATWTSSNSAIAKHVGNGEFELLKAGTVTITAKYGKTSVKFTLKIVNLMTGLNLTTKNDVTEVRSGKTLQITAKPHNNPTNKALTWTTSDKTVATVNASGKVTAKTVKVNTPVTITAAAKDGSGVQETIELMVKPAKDRTFYLVQGYEDNYLGNVVNGKTENVYTLGEMESALIQLRPMVYDSTTDQWENVTATVTYTNGKNVTTNKAEGMDWMDPNEYFLNTLGTYTFTAKYSGSTVKFTAKVSRLTDGIEITGKDYMAAGTSLQLTGKVLNNPSNKSLTWSSSDTSVATVNTSGKVTAKKVYDMQVVTITATAKDAAIDFPIERQTVATFNVTVYPAATSVEIKESTLGKAITNLTIERDLAVNNTFSVEALVHPYSFEDFEHQFGASQDVTWKSSNNAIAKPDANGNIAMLKEGTVTITATTTDGSKKSASFKLKVVHSVPGISLLNEVNGNEELEIKGGTKLTLQLKAETFDKFPTSKVSFKLNDYGAKCGATVSSTGVITTKTVKQPTLVDLIITEKANPDNQWTFKLLITP